MILSGITRKVKVILQLTEIPLFGILFLKEGGGNMKKILVLFLILILVSGCKKKDITYECKTNNGNISTVVVLTVTGDYKKVKQYNATTFLILSDEEELQRAAEGVKKDFPNATVSVEGNTLKTYIDYIDEISTSIDKETFNKELAYLESFGAICEIKK